MTGAVVFLIILILSTYVGVNEKISSNVKTGYFAVILLIVVVMVLVQIF